MDRLTIRNGDGAWDVPLRWNDDGAFISLQDIFDRLAAYEDTGLEPEEIKRSDALLRGFIDLSRRHARTLPWIEKVMIADREGRLLVLPCGDDVTPIKCTGLNCPMQVGKVDPATCKAADTCEWATKSLTNADRIRAMTDEELAIMIDGHYFLLGCPAGEFYKHKCHRHESCYHCWLDWLKQEVSDNEL